MKNITLSVEERVIERARAVAQKRNTTLNALVRAYLEDLAGYSHGAQASEELGRRWAKEAGHSGGRSITRDEAYEDRL